ncbi:MAG: terminase small subunit, partial [Aestuariivirga sp.]
DPDEFGVLAQLTDKQEIFVREYMVDWNATQAAIRAGYSPRRASEQAYQLLQNPSVREAIETLASARARRLGIDADELMRMWASIVFLDANEISQLRRVCCPFCWGEGHARQYTPSGLEDSKKKHERERARRKKADSADDIGDFPEYIDAWYDKRKEPHEDCPECHGQGVVEVFFNDTRKLSPAARMLYAGVKEGRDGIEVLTLSKEKAMDSLARALGLFKEKDVEVNINMVSGEDLYRIYEDKMHQARSRQAAVLSERGLIEAHAEVAEDDPGKSPEPETTGN